MRTLRLILALGCFGCGAAWPQETSPRLDADGTAHAAATEIPYSSLASEGARRFFVEKLFFGQSIPKPANTDIATLRTHLDEYRARPGVERLRKLFPVTIRAEKIAGVQTDVIEPQQGPAGKNRQRVLINLHGGGFAAGARYGGQQESIPIANLGRFKVITIDYRMAPEFGFPAASEDVATVYRELLKRYSPRAIGIYGCSAGGILAAQSMAWFQKQGLPAPGAVGMFGGAGVVGRWGDSNYFAPLLEGNPAPSVKDSDTAKVLQYFAMANLDDPLVSPAYSQAVLGKFPPALLISGTRDAQLSTVIYTHAQLIKARVDARLHVWEGAPHCGFAVPIGDPDIPENREAWQVIVDFFDQQLQKNDSR